jgi:hypothetical protein
MRIGKGKSPRALRAATAAAVLWLAAPAMALDECDHGALAEESRGVERQAGAVERAAAAAPGYRRVADRASGVARVARRMADGASAGVACHRLENELDRALLPAMDALRDAVALAEESHPSSAVRRAVDRLESAVDRLADAFHFSGFPPDVEEPPFIGPFPIPGPGQPPIIVPFPPFPRPTPCGRVVGNYTGVCRSSAGASTIAFRAVHTGTACVATNATHF